MEPTHSSFRGATNLDIAEVGYATLPIYLAGLMMDGFV